MSINTPKQETEMYGADDRNLIIDLLFSNKNPLIVEALRQAGIRTHRSISAARLRDHVEAKLDNDDITLSQLVEILNKLEAWGRQQIYLYQFTGGTTLQNQWLDTEWVTSHFDSMSVAHLFNQTRPLVMPDEPTLVSIMYDKENQRIRFIWLQKRITYTRAEQFDPDAGTTPIFRTPESNQFNDGDVDQVVDTTADEVNDNDRPESVQLRGSTIERIIYRAFRETTVRGIMAFEWEIPTGNSMLTIYKVSGANYAQIREERIAELATYIPIDDFVKVPIRPVVTRLEQTDEVIRRNLSFQSLNDEGGTLSVSSGGKNDVFEDEVLEDARKEIIGDVTGLRGLLYWKKTNNKLMAVELYSRVTNDQRIGISAQEMEDDIRHVLRRIRTYCT